ncbi:hypothetical protein [Thalassotalea euphylliae]|uniref:Uncharacterized protein n=1 Tax=Thalassotalea euphylliae TaxID=1655234 RepID=A0A3E0UDB4_9GAMM|nr:hypothetical protein [Thalassotalea euphylliae]REL34704.1 hypothetical protein DXX92_04655 [Thalassotalea euphylliae]
MDKFLKAFVIGAGVWFVYMLPTMLTNFGKAVAAEHPLTSYLSVENALILDAFPYPDDCKKEMIDFMGDNGMRCQQMWQRQVALFKKYGIEASVEELKSSFYWAMRKDVLSKARKLTSGTLRQDASGNVLNSHKYSKEQIEKNRNARELMQVQKQSLEAFEAKRKG